MSASAGQVQPDVAEPRGVVTQQDALDAILQLAAAIDTPPQPEIVPGSQARSMAALLMVVRDYIQPLPPGMGPDGDGGQSDHATKDLEEMVAGLRAARDHAVPDHTAQPS